MERSHSIYYYSGSFFSMLLVYPLILFLMMPFNLRNRYFENGDVDWWSIISGDLWSGEENQMD